MAIGDREVYAYRPGQEALEQQRLAAEATGDQKTVDKITKNEARGVEDATEAALLDEKIHIQLLLNASEKIAFAITAAEESMKFEGFEAGPNDVISKGGLGNKTSAKEMEEIVNALRKSYDKLRTKISADTSALVRPGPHSD